DLKQIAARCDAVLGSGPEQESLRVALPPTTHTGGNDKGASSGREQMQQSQRRKPIYSITSLPMPSTPAAIVSPRALAVLRLIARSNLVGSSTGRSAGDEPRRIRSASAAAR